MFKHKDIDYGKVFFLTVTTLLAAAVIPWWIIAIGVAFLVWFIYA